MFVDLVQSTFFKSFFGLDAIFTCFSNKKEKKNQ